MPTSSMSSKCAAWRANSTGSITGPSSATSGIAFYYRGLDGVMRADADQAVAAPTQIQDARGALGAAAWSR